MMTQNVLQVPWSDPKVAMNTSHECATSHRLSCTMWYKEISDDGNMSCNVLTAMNLTQYKLNMTV
jgi:hypothetical protein